MNEYDKIFWPDRSVAETTHLKREGKRFFEAAIRRKSIDRIFWPDLDADEALDLLQEGQAFFEAVMRRKK